MPENQSSPPRPNPSPTPEQSPDRRIQNAYGPSYTQIGNHNTQVISPALASLFLELDAFENLLRGRHPSGFSVPYIRNKWTESETPIQQGVMAFLRSHRRVALLAAPGGYGKTRLALELGRWARETLGMSVVAVEPDRAGPYAGHLHELPEGPLMILVDDAEKAKLPVLLNELAKRTGLAEQAKVVALTRSTFLSEIRQTLAPFGAVQITLPGLQKLTYEESCELLEALEVYGEDHYERLHRHTSGIPLFLILAVDMAKAGQNYYRLASGNALLDLYLEDALQVMVNDGQDHQHSQRVLGTLALLGRVRPGTPRDLACLARLTDLPASTVERVLEAATGAGLLGAGNGRYRYSYDLILERAAVRFVPLPRALEILKAFDFREYGTDFSDVLHAVCLLAFQRDDGLDDLIRDFDALLPSLRPADRVSFVNNVLQSVMRTHPEVALHWAEHLIYGRQEMAEQDAGAVPARSHDGFLVSLILEAVTPLARMPAFQRRVLAIVALACRLDNARASGAAGKLLAHAATPQPTTSRPLEGLPELLDVIHGWLHSPLPVLWGHALNVLEHLTRIEVRDTRTHPDSRMQLRITRSRLPLEWPPYQALYGRVQDEVEALPEQVISTYGDQIGRLLALAISQAELGDASAEMQAAAQRWFEVTEALLARLGAVHARHLVRKARWLVRYRRDHRAPLASQLLDRIHHLPQYASVDLLCDPPSMRDFHEETDLQAKQLLVHTARVALAREVVNHLAAEEFSKLILRLEGLEAKMDVPGAIRALLCAEPTYGLQVFRDLVSRPTFAPQVMPALFAVFAHTPEMARRLTNDVLDRAVPQQVEALLPFYVHLATADGELESRLLTLAQHPDPRIRAAVARSWAVPRECRQRVLQAAVAAGAIDEELGRALLIGMHQFQHEEPISSALAQLFLEATCDLELENLDDSTGAIEELGRDLSAAEPLWLLEHLERRASQVDPSDLHWDEPRTWAALFSGSPRDPGLFPVLLDRLWWWSRGDQGRLLSRAALKIFGQLGQHCPAGAKGFILEKVASTSDLDVLKEAIQWGFELGDDVAGEVTDAAIRQGITPGSQDPISALGECLVSRFSLGTQFKEGHGPWPKDERMLKMARSRKETARQRQLLGEAGDGRAVVFWERLEQRAQQNIRQTLREELLREDE